MKKGNQIFFYYYNAHGDVIALTDQNDKKIATYVYDAWGNVLQADEADQIKDNPYRYAGYQYDHETGLYYLIARYYQPEHGVFLSLDPDPGNADDMLTQNGYTYANNNPVMLLDPNGHWVMLVINGGFAIYDGYQVYKAGGSGREVALAAGSSFIGIGKVNKAAKGLKVVSKGNYSSLYLQFFANKGMNNYRPLNKYKKGGYDISLDLERGGSGLVNIHVKVDNTKYFYDFNKGRFYVNGKELPSSLRKDKKIQGALNKALDKLNSGW